MRFPEADDYNIWDVFDFQSLVKASAYTKLRVHGIYKIWHVVYEDRIYIGSASNFFRSRWYRHIRDLQNNKHHAKKLQRIVNKYGIDGLRFQILEVVAPEDCKRVEQIYLDALHPFYNSNPSSIALHIFTEKDKLKAKKKQRYNDKMFGRQPMSQNTKDIISLTRQKKPLYQYDLEGNFIYKFPSILDAARSLHTKSTKSLIMTARQERLSSHGYIWLWERDDVMAKERANAKRQYHFLRNTKKIIVRNLKTDETIYFHKLQEVASLWGVSKARVCKIIKSERVYRNEYIIAYE